MEYVVYLPKYCVGIFGAIPHQSRDNCFLANYRVSYALIPKLTIKLRAIIWLRSLKNAPALGS